MKTMENQKEFVVLSPDGIRISYNKTYKTEEDAYEAFKLWVENYRNQGYYSSVEFGRIDLEDMEHYCQMVEI